MRGNPFARAVVQRDGFPVLPGRYPLIGHAWVFFGDLLEVLRGGHARLGPLFWMNLFLDRWLLVCEGALGFEALRSKAVANGHIRKEKAGELILGGSMLSQDGEAHRHVRSAMAGLFNPRGLATGALGGPLAAVIDEHVARWCARGSVVAKSDTMELTLEAVFRIAGVPADDLPIWREQFTRFLAGAFAPPILLPGTPLHRAARSRRWLDERIHALVRRAREAPDPESLIGFLVLAKDDRGAPLTDHELVDNIRLLLIAGHETTASVLSWVLVELARSPDLWAAVREEGTKAPAAPRTLREAQSFPVAESVFREAARLYSPVTLTLRKLVAPLSLGGRAIPDGAFVGVSPSLACRDPAVYPDPDRFDPSRWQRRREPPSQYELMAFGAGAHFCLGYHLAWMEGVQFVVTFARRMAERGLSPRLAPGARPRLVYTPALSHVSADTVVHLLP
ncbi:MAG: cytochrome P450 [Polyangiaceae bacterium]